MKKTLLLMTVLLLAFLVSGCALVGHHTSNVEKGTKTTFGLFTFDEIDNGYPLIPFYSGFKEAK